jgi:biotin transport system substrate-specific component
LTITLAAGRPTLADRIFSRHIATDLVLIAAGTALTAIAAQITIPMVPVPITGQTFAVLLTGAVLGSARGAISMVLYAGLALVGLPVLTPNSDGSHTTGASVLALPSFGFVVGFVAAAAFVGWLAQRQWDHHVLKTIVSFAGGSVIIYAFGATWLGVSLTHSVAGALELGVKPFLIGDVLKAVAAGILLPVTWRLVRRADDVKADRED